MINFRYHVVSIVAVFLALALGILMGTTVISNDILKRLNQDSRDFARRNSEYRAQIDGLEDERAFLQRFGTLMMAPAVKGKLAGRSLVLLTQDGVPSATVDKITEALRDAGAQPALPRIRMTAAWALQSEGDQSRLAGALAIAPAASPAPGADTLLERAADAMGRRLVSSGNARDASDVLKRLSDAGFIHVDNLPADSFPSAGTALIVVPSGASGAMPAQSPFFTGLLDVLATHRPVVVAEPYRSADSLCVRVRADGTLGTEDSTVDHVDTAAGQMSLVWALRGELDGKPVTHYGTARGAQAIAPDLSTSA